MLQQSGHDVMMGDLVLLQEEVNPVMSALLEHGLEVTALHNHFFWAQPEVFFMHIHGHGKAVDLANQIKPALWTSLDMRRPPQPRVTPPQVLRRKPRWTRH